MTYLRICNKCNHSDGTASKNCRFLRTNEHVAPAPATPIRAPLAPQLVVVNGGQRCPAGAQIRLSTVVNGAQRRLEPGNWAYHIRVAAGHLGLSDNQIAQLAMRSPTTQGTACRMASRISLMMLMHVSRRASSGSSTGTQSTVSGANPSRNRNHRRQLISPTQGASAVDLRPRGHRSTANPKHGPHIQIGASALRRTGPYATALKPVPTPGNPRIAKDRRDSRVMARHPNDVSHRR